MQTQAGYRSPASANAGKLPEVAHLDRIVIAPGLDSLAAVVKSGGPDDGACEACVLRLLAVIAAHLFLVPPFLLAIAALGRVDHPMGDLLVQFSAAALVATLALTLVLALLNLTPAVVSALAVTALLVLANWPQWFPGNGRTAVADAPALSVYSANLWVYNRNTEAIARSIQQADADILVLVELGAEARARADQLFEAYPHRLYAGLTDHPSQSAIISRYPLTTIRGPRHRETVAALAHTPLGPINVVGVHLTRPWPYQPPDAQAGQVRQLARLRDQLHGPVIMAGDFNAVSSGRIGRQVRSSMGLIPAPGWPGTWPHRLPSPLGMTLDQVWFSQDLVLQSRRLAADTGSDHRPVLTRFRPARPPAP